jgi:hypothetical protein
MICLKIFESLFKILSEDLLELCNNLNDWMAGILKLLSDFEVNFPNHPRQVVKCFHLG